MIQELQERIATLRMKVEEAWHLLGLDTVKNEIEALEAATMAPDFGRIKNVRRRRVNN
jgi:hypothetical protein